jgi:hypothetical protein
VRDFLAAHTWQSALAARFYGNEAHEGPLGPFRTVRKFARIRRGSVARNYGKTGDLCDKAQDTRRLQRPCTSGGARRRPGPGRVWRRTSRRSPGNSMTSAARRGGRGTCASGSGNARGSRGWGFRAAAGCHGGATVAPRENIAIGALRAVVHAVTRTTHHTYACQKNGHHYAWPDEA